ncbi:hypothetical protein [Pseudomonas huaxiensis]|uniref:hypothetical protein n=1 Tax=Pseudomonas huaxiensis TaxID=2213017 RepID=UPI000DA69942|nr:hypothetical protein [Pseudomonas huaxiensis]
MSFADVLYRGPVDLTLTYGEVGGLGREAQRLGADLVLSRRTKDRPLAVLLPKALYLDVLKGPSRARLTLPDGRVFAGRVTERTGNGEYFELVEDGECVQSTD